MVRRDLSENLKVAGGQLLDATDALDMQAQGAMWVYNHRLESWRYYLVTSLVDTLGRRKVYGLLLEIFQHGDFPEAMTIEDVHLGSPNDEFFRVVSRIARVDGKGSVEFKGCQFNDMSFDGVIYRSVDKAPSDEQARRIEKRFQRRVRDLIR